MTITIQSVTKTFGDVVALDDVSLTIEQGTFFALLGPSGCGKTTLLRSIGGFEFPSQGKIAIDGKDMSKVAPNKRPVNTVFQSYAVFPHLNVFENVAYGLRVVGTDAGEIARRVDEAVAMTKLEGFQERMPDQLSGGQRQRVALARALVKRPKVLLLDEPLSALDKKLREAMQFELVRLREEVGITFVIVTHDQSEAMAVADRIAVMNAGRIVQVDEPRQLYAFPKSRFVADFLGTANVFECEVRQHAGGRATVHSKFLGEIEVVSTAGNSAEAVLMLRPECLWIGPAGTAVPANHIPISATLEESTFQGGQYLLRARLEDGNALIASVHSRTMAQSGPYQFAIDPQDLVLVSR